MTDSVTIALDVMGGDHGADSVLPAAVSQLQADPSLRLILVGDESLIRERLKGLGSLPESRMVVHHASEQIEMGEPPMQALRGKPDSSMRVGLNLLRDGEAQAFVSAGNTGALVALSHFVVRMLPGIDRPAIQSTVPSLNGHTHVLDLGGNVDSRAEHLLQFAVMGSVLAQVLDDNARPRVGLLNVGEENIKGNRQVQAADVLLRESRLNYIGFIEGDDIYCSDVDVVVCDGFVGNISLKTTEGVARMLITFLKEEFKRNLYRRLAMALSAPILKGFRRLFDPRRYNGASLLGLRHVVIKSHGSADAFAFEQAIIRARQEARRDLPMRIDQNIDTLLADRVEVEAGS